MFPRSTGPRLKPMRKLRRFRRQARNRLSQFLNYLKMRFEWVVLQRIGSADQEGFELLDPGMLSVHLSTQPSINQHLFHKLAVLQPQFFDLLARFCVAFVLNLAHFKWVFIGIVYRPDSLFSNLSCCNELERSDRWTL